MAAHIVIKYPGLPREGESGYMVLLLQDALRNRRLAPDLGTLVVNGYFGPQTAAAVVDFQEWMLLRCSPGKVDATTWVMLGLSLPEDGGLEQRVQRFIEHVGRRYNIAVGKTGSFRRPDDAQLWHICHMFLYNRFNGFLPQAVRDAQRKSAKAEVSLGRTIPWEHMSKPGTDWADGGEWGWLQVLRTKDRQTPPELNDAENGWEPGREPDEEATRERARSILAAAGIGPGPDGTPHSGQVAPGYDGCREPCLCGNRASRHTLGKAADLSNLKELANRLTAEGIGTLDECLACFGLWRPLVDLRNAAEFWHVEEIPLAAMPRLHCGQTGC